MLLPRKVWQSHSCGLWFPRGLDFFAMGHASRDQVFPESSALWHAEEMASSIRAHGRCYGKVRLCLTLWYPAPRDSLKSQLCVCCASDKRGPFVVPSGFHAGAPEQLSFERWFHPWAPRREHGVPRFSGAGEDGQMVVWARDQLQRRALFDRHIGSSAPDPKRLRSRTYSASAGVLTDFRV